ncbi:hypothetical protein ACWDBF_10150 [Streptomyces angustmyceticus]
MPDELEGGDASPSPHPDEMTGSELTAHDLITLERDLTQGTESADGELTRARRENDRKIVNALRADGFEGPRYEKFVARLTEYGWSTMNKWTANGEIFRKARQVGRPVPVHKVTTTWTRDDRQDVATDSVLGGLHVFRSYGLIQGHWSPDGGASLPTFFMGAVIRAFPRIYIRWFDNRQFTQAELARYSDPDEQLDMLAFIPDPRVTDPCAAAAANDYVDRLLPYVKDPQIREGLGWRALGYTQGEAALRVGLTEKALERRISRVRIKLNSHLRQLELGEGGAR